MSAQSQPPKISIVGSGPGDPDLLTLGAYKRFQSCDLVLYDALVSPEVLELIPENTEKVFVGKRSGKPSFSQKSIGELYLHYAKEKDRIVRLKGGDTSIFARLTEEIEVLEENDIPFEILAGVTTCSGAAARLEMGLTSREYGSEFLITTARSFRDMKYCEIMASFLNKGSGLAIYMPFHQGSFIVENLRAAGAKNDLPVVLSVFATTPRQRILHRLLGDVSWEKMREFAAGDPAIFLVGRPFTKKEYSLSVNHP